jgi:hypothetical protein
VSALSALLSENKKELLFEKCVDRKRTNVYNDLRTDVQAVNYHEKTSLQNNRSDKIFLIRFYMHPCYGIRRLQLPQSEHSRSSNG